MIDEYQSGSHMTVNGKAYHQDLKIIDRQVKGNWWRKQGHRLDPDDIADVLSAKPGVLVIGTGYAGNLRVPESTRSVLSEQNIRLIAEQTEEAARTFNHLHDKGENVAGAFHLTC